jgi:hypothetical protein
MAIVLDERITEGQRSVVHYLWAKKLNAKNIHREMFSVCFVTCLSCKAVHYWVKKHGKGFADDEEVRKWLRQQSKDFFMLRVSTHW